MSIRSIAHPFRENQYRVDWVNPAAIKQYEGLKYTDDRYDAFWLAHLMRLGQPSTAPPQKKDKNAQERSEGHGIQPLNLTYDLFKDYIWSYLEGDGS